MYPKQCLCFFRKTKSRVAEPDIFVAGEKLEAVSEFKYLGVLIDSNLSFKAHIKKVCNRVKFNLANFKYIRSCMSLEAAMMYMHSMIFSHITYCLTTWSQASNTALKPLLSLYKQTLKVLDKKPKHYHHCQILTKYKFLNWENLIKYTDSCLMYKILHKLAPPVLRQFVNTGSTACTRSAVRGDCILPLRKSAFSQSAFSIKAARDWNLIPTQIRDLQTYASFKVNLKKWLTSSQLCQH